MPFFDDNAPDESALRSPIWGAFALVKDNIEKLIAVNMFWAFQLVPILIAVAFPGMWTVLRIVLAIVSATTLAASTGVLYAIAKYVCEGEPVTIDLFRDCWRSYALPSARILAPLYGTLGVVLVLILLSPFTQFLPLQVLLDYLALMLFALSFYWGPLFADQPDASAWQIFKRGARLFWRYPAPTLLSGALIVFLLGIGIFSVAGMLLIIPIIVALLQTRRYQEVASRILLARQNRQRMASMSTSIE